jgi:hypothetical protein
MVPRSLAANPFLSSAVVASGANNSLAATPPNTANTNNSLIDSPPPLISQFFGSSAAFTQTQPLLIPDDYKQVLQQQLDRPTTKEKTVIHQIATGSVTITDLQKSLDLSPADIIDVLQSIDLCSLLQKDTTDAGMSFGVSIVLQQILQ